jgi:hypothetical protein
MNQIGDEGATFLCEGLVKLIKLTTLDLNL